MKVGRREFLLWYMGVVFRYKGKDDIYFCFFLDGVVVEYDGFDFVWEEYLEDIGLVVVFNEVFKYVSVWYSIRLIR